MKPDPYPLLLKPAYKNYLWGGTRIAEVYGRETPPGPVAESWEVSTRPEGMSLVLNGPLAGRTLQEAIDTMGEDLLGARAPRGQMPLLIKLIDARDRLSVQVHPDDESAALHGGEAKTEMWILLDAEPGACLFAGFRPGLARPEIEQAIREGRWTEILQTLPVRAGDAVFIPGGRVHAIGAGCLILEIQQNSNTTYRLYDWDRKGSDGKPRKLHLEQALSVIRWEDPGEPLLQP
ncbi:MAG: type I phosphomannose isomerase catalytic subunit, partial [Kiritimatiellia bacterium]|nr:type I phosphomannose isomerase catalytic subunit [Kiritimatiellia bacterium]